MLDKFVIAAGRIIIGAVVSKVISLGIEEIVNGERTTTIGNVKVGKDYIVY